MQDLWLPASCAWNLAASSYSYFHTGASSLLLALISQCLRTFICTALGKRFFQLRHEGSAKTWTTRAEMETCCSGTGL